MRRAHRRHARNEDGGTHRLVRCTEALDGVTVGQAEFAMKFRFLPVGTHRPDTKAIDPCVRGERLGQFAHKEQQPPCLLLKRWLAGWE